MDAGVAVLADMRFPAQHRATLYQPARAPQRRDQAPQRGRRDRPERLGRKADRGGHAPDRRLAAGAERRVGRAARPLRDPRYHRATERWSRGQTAITGSLTTQPTLTRKHRSYTTRWDRIPGRAQLGPAQSSGAGTPAHREDRSAASGRLMRTHQRYPRTGAIPAGPGQPSRTGRPAPPNAGTDIQTSRASRPRSRRCGPPAASATPGSGSATTRSSRTGPARAAYGGPLLDDGWLRGIINSGGGTVRFTAGRRWHAAVPIR